MLRKVNTFETLTNKKGQMTDFSCQRRTRIHQLTLFKPTDLVNA